MTQYTQNELANDWEFKIVQSVTEAFKKPEVVALLKEEEALAGWRMVEKFDNNRIRFKRPASAQRKDHMLPMNIDPYRTQYGMSSAGLGLRILVVVFLLLGVIIAIGVLSGNM